VQVKDVMTADVTTTTVETPLREAAELLVARKISGMPVVGDDGSVLGVLSEADVLAKERRAPDDERSALARVLHRDVPQDAKHEARLVGEAMTAPAITIPAYVSLATAAGRMLEHGVNRLPVTQRGLLIGIVTRADLVRAFVRPDEEIAAEARDQVAFQQALVNDANVVEVAVENGDAVLTGSVRQRSDSDILPSLVRQVPGVVRVRSELSWSEEE
jgi:CBS domain-containing protein